LNVSDVAQSEWLVAPGQPGAVVVVRGRSTKRREEKNSLRFGIGRRKATEGDISYILVLVSKVKDRATFTSKFECVWMIGFVQEAKLNGTSEATRVFSKARLKASLPLFDQVDRIKIATLKFCPIDLSY